MISVRFGSALLAAGPLFFANIASAQTVLEPVADIPQVQNFRGDGNDDDWRDQGLPLNVWSGNALRVQATSQFGVTARVGWNEQGLLALVRVVDATPREAAVVEKLYDGDSVELLLKNSDPAMGMLQLIAAAGDVGKPVHRQHFFDYRDTKLKLRAPATGQSWSHRSDDGYVVEIMLPWSNLDIEPATGTIIGARISVNNAQASGPNTRLTWVAPRSAYDFFDLPRVRLAIKGANAPQSAVWGTYEDLETTHINIVAESAKAGREVQIRDAGVVLASAKLQADGETARVTLSFPAPTSGRTNGTLLITLDEELLGELKLPDISQERVAIFKRGAGDNPYGDYGRDNSVQDWAQPRFSSVAFTGAMFPTFGYSDPAHARRQFGETSTRIDFYDAKGKKVTRAFKAGRYGAVVTVADANGNKVTSYRTLFRRPDKVASDSSFNGADAILLSALWEARGKKAPSIDAVKADRDWWHSLRKRLGTAIKYEYFVRVPAAYARDTNRRWPVIFYLHGSGGGDLVTDVQNNAIQAKAKTNPNFGFIAVSLRSPGGWYPPAVREVMDEVERRFRIDKERVYLAGFSMGGIGSWEIAYDQPGRFAAIVPVGARAGDATRMARLKGAQVWVINGADDPTTTAADARRAVQSLKDAGVDVRYSEVPGGHTESLNYAFDGDELYQWLAQRRRKK